MSDAEYIKYLEKVLAAIGGNVYWLDKNCVYQGCNDNVAHMLGLKSGKDIAGLTDRDLHHFGLWGIEQATSFLADDLEVIRTGKPKSSVEEPIIFGTNGEPIFFYTTRTPIFDDNGEIIGIVGTSTDITSLKKAQKDLMLAKQQADAANRAKTEFLANMSHDMKTPLSGIVTTAEVIAHDQTAREQDREFAAMISASGKQLSAFFTSCLDLSKLEMEEWASAKSVFSIHQITQDIYELYLPKAKSSGLTLSVICDPNLPEAVEGHQDILYRTLLNLTGNGLKFTKSGSVTIRAMRGEQIDREHTTIIFEVEDTGIGIPQDKFKIIFEKLQRLTPSYSSNIEGSGIGLYIVDQFIKRIGGSIQVNSEIKKGSKFTVSIPMLIAPASLARKPNICIKSETQSTLPSMPNFSAKISSSTPRILLVEDVLIVQIATKSLLDRAGFHVDTASSGQEAITLCASKKYDIIYMDIGLPDMRGDEAARFIRQQEQIAGKHPTPIIALTGHGAIDIKSFCEYAGIQGVLSKPILREQAEALWQRYGKNQVIDVPNLITFEKCSIKPMVFDSPKTVAILGSEQKAREMAKAFIKELDTNYLPNIAGLIKQQDRTRLRFVLHQLLGCLSYVAFPLLKEAVTILHDITREETIPIKEAYEQIIIETKKAKDALSYLE